MPNSLVVHHLRRAGADLERHNGETESIRGEHRGRKPTVVAREDQRGLDEEQLSCSLDEVGVADDDGVGVRRRTPFDCPCSISLCPFYFP